MIAECKEKGDEGFEDQLTADFVYPVLEHGANSVKVINDRGDLRWYGTSHFDLTG